MGRSMRGFRNLFVLIAAALMLAALAGCFLRGGAPAGALTYKGPAEISLKPGETLTGTDIVYVGLSDSMAEFTIEGQRALKKAGDSLDWKGEPVEGVKLDLGLRLLLLTDQTVHTGGTVDIEVANAEPVAQPVESESPIKFGVPVTYGIDRGEMIPGTLISYEERDEDRGAKLGGIEDYAYRKTGDSIVWEGKLRGNVWLRLDVRVLFYNETSLRVGGIATLWLEK